MNEDKNIDQNEDSIEDNIKAGIEPNRRRVLMMGAVAASSVVSVKPALAQTGVSLLNCTIPVVRPNATRRYILPNGELVNAGTPGAFPSPERSFTGEEVRVALKGNAFKGEHAQQSLAYIQYMKRLQRGQQGFTCFASLQSGS